MTKVKNDRIVWISPDARDIDERVAELQLRFLKEDTKARMICGTWYSNCFLGCVQAHLQCRIA